MKKTSISKVLINIHLYGFFILSVISCGGSNNSNSSGNKDSGAVNKEAAKTEAESLGWVYSEKEDKMEGGKKYFAELTATEKLNFEFPYDGGSTAKLSLRNAEGKNAVMLSVSKGQYNSDITGENNSLKMKFDDEKPLTVSYALPSDGSSDIIFINSEAEVISKLKTAKKVLIEVEFYNEGNRQIEFIVDGLKWDHK